MDKQTVIADLAAAADELHRSGAGHPNVVKAIERAIAHFNADVIDPADTIERQKAAVADTDRQDALNKAKVNTTASMAGKPYKPLSVDPDATRRLDPSGKPYDLSADPPLT